MQTPKWSTLWQQGSPASHSFSFQALEKNEWDKLCKVKMDVKGFIQGFRLKSSYHHLPNSHLEQM